MALLRSLTTGSTSLRAHQQRLDVIANNIANVNTVGYKAGQATFVDQLSQLMSYGSAPSISTSNATGAGGLNPAQIGLGVRLGSIRSDFTQGTIRSTNRALDVAINGDAYFALNLNGASLYGKAGNFSLDRDGNVVDSVTGAFVQGFNSKTDTATGRFVKDASGITVLDRTLSSIRINPNTKLSPKQSSEIKLSGNISAALTTGESVTNSINIYDNVGASHVLALTFTRTAAATPTYTITGTIDGNSIDDGATPPVTTLATLTFNPDGTVATPVSLDFDVTSTRLNAALGAGSTAFDTTSDVQVTLSESSSLLSGITQLAGQSSLNLVSQNGYAAGNLQGMSIDPTGKIVGAFSNGQSETLAQLAVARFTNSGGLVKNGDSLFAASFNSGLPNIGTAVEIFPSVKVVGGALEDSNVDLTEQFTDLISTQRGFEAAARTVTISDQMLQEINQLKR